MLILDEAHERSLNIDFLLGYLKRLLVQRADLKLVISSATLDAGAFAAFFAGAGGPVPVIVAPGRMFPVAEFFLPPMDDEELPQHVARAVDWLGGVEPRGDVLVFLPGEREIRECAEVLEGRRYPGTEVLPLFARLGLGDQQRVFNPGHAAAPDPRHQRRRNLSHHPAHRLRDRFRRGARQPLEPGQGRAAPANRTGQPGQRPPAQGPLRPRARRRLRAAL